MIFEKILNYLKQFLEEADPDKAYIEKMSKILSKLKDKAQKLEAQLKNEKIERKRKDLNLMLKVIYKQQEKGKRLIQERERICHSPRKDKIVIKPMLSPPAI